MNQIPIKHDNRPDDPALNEVVDWFHCNDPQGHRMARVFRETFDQLYDGQRTGRYKWDQLFKTEKTHFGTLIEINLQREFSFQDGLILDYKIAGHEIDSKYSATGAWMLPPESINQLILGSKASDERAVWSVGIVRASLENRNVGKNRDQKGSLSAFGKSQIQWVFKDAPMQPNILLQLPEATVQGIMGQRSGQTRVNELFRKATNLRISRNIIATVAQQPDYMKRVRANGGARSILKNEGILILSGDYKNQTAIARQLGCNVPMPGELVSVRVGPVDIVEAGVVELSGKLWAVNHDGSPTHEPAPTI